MPGQILLTIPPFIERERVCEYVCISSVKECKEHTQNWVLLDSGQTGPVDPNFLCQEPSLNQYGPFEPKTKSLDHSV